METGDCAEACEPCRWIELGSRLSIPREVASATKRKRTRIERRAVTAIPEKAYARRNKMNTNASLPVAFGNVIGTQVHLPARTNAQGGVSHGE